MSVNRCGLRTLVNKQYRKLRCNSQINYTITYISSALPLYNLQYPLDYFKFTIGIIPEKNVYFLY